MNGATIVKSTDAMDEALAVLQRGGLVAIPTETVYGLAADATNGSAVAGIFEAKGRPSFNPLIAHVASMAMAEQVAIFDDQSRALAAAFWPGPLTIVLPRAEGCPVHPLATAGLETIAVRMPAGFGAELVQRFGRPLAAPSANSSGRISATTAAHVATDLGGKVDLIVDGGPTPVGVESTIVKVEGGNIMLLRPGGISVEELQARSGKAVARPAAGKIEAPGMLSSHYAPKARMRLDATAVGSKEALLAFGALRVPGADRAFAFRNLSATGDLREAAANLFAHMQDLDAAGARVIAVEPIPFEGLGEAINDRLARAAADRPE